MNDSLYTPLRPLEAGSRVALVAPSGILRDDVHVHRAEENARSLGWEPVLGENVSAAHAYFAGTDDERTRDLNAAINDDSIDGIWCVRGGYGAMRLLRKIDYQALKSNPRPLIGFSDITALHSAVWRECGIVTFHGPTARGELSDFSREHMLRAVVEGRDSCGAAPDGRVLRSGRASGRLAGGNLALIVSLMATRWEVDFEGAILVIEDIDEAVYRVDRMMQQLLLSGALARCAGIVAGDFKLPANEAPTDNRTVDDVIAEVAEAAGIPCFSGAPFGHISDQWTIPLGAYAEMDTSDCSLRVKGAR